MSSTLLSSPPVSSSLPSSPPLFSPPLLIWSGIHSLLFAILMKIRHLPCQPSPLSADPCHNNKEKRHRQKEIERKASEEKSVGESPYLEEGYYVTAGLGDLMVRWPSEDRKKWSLSFWVAATEVFSHSERTTIWCWLSYWTGDLITPAGGLTSLWSGASVIPFHAGIRGGHF